MVYKTSHALITHDYTNQTARRIRKEMHPGLRIVHIFATNDDISAAPLMALARRARYGGFSVVVHCSDKKVRCGIRKKLKGVPKGKWFHLSLMHGNMVFALSRELELRVTRNGGGMSIEPRLSR